MSAPQQAPTPAGFSDSSLGSEVFHPLRYVTSAERERLIGRSRPKTPFRPEPRPGSVGSHPRCGQV
eukprot:scaffold938_cov334-Pavlova_lutheri.AAC.55